MSSRDSQAPASSWNGQGLRGSAQTKGSNSAGPAQLKMRDSVPQLLQFELISVLCREWCKWSSLAALRPQLKKMLFQIRKNKLWHMSKLIQRRKHSITTLVTCFLWKKILQKYSAYYCIWSVWSVPCICFYYMWLFLQWRNWYIPRRMTQTLRLQYQHCWWGCFARLILILRKDWWYYHPTVEELLVTTEYHT
jgi:hypothetical protein